MQLWYLCHALLYFYRVLSVYDSSINFENQPRCRSSIIATREPTLCSTLLQWRPMCLWCGRRRLLLLLDAWCCGDAGWLFIATRGTCAGDVCTGDDSAEVCLVTSEQQVSRSAGQQVIGSTLLGPAVASCGRRRTYCLLVSFNFNFNSCGGWWAASALDLHHRRLRSAAVHGSRA